LADQFIFGIAPFDYSPVFLLKPFRSHLTMDTLSSNALTNIGQQGITPAFGYSSPHPRARGTLTLLINALPSAHYDVIRLLYHLFSFLAFILVG
jgi:hypothetical protein